MIPQTNQLVIGIVGPRGSGKTLLLTDYLRDAYEHGRKVIANYHLSFPFQYMRLKEVAQMPPSMRNAVVGLDELHIAADSRDFMGVNNRRISTLITQMRKRQCTVYYTTQFMSQVDRRIRLHTDLLIRCEALEPGIVEASVHDYQKLAYSHRTDHFLDSFVFDGSPIFHLYDTNEIILWDEEGEETAHGGVIVSSDAWPE